MPTYSHQFEDKRKTLNTLIKSLNGKEDRAILRAIYGVTNIDDFYNRPDRLDRVKKTAFSGVDTKTLLGHFRKDIFNTKGNNYYEEIFQEVYNRQAKFHGYEPRYIVEVAGDSATTNGFMRHGANQLNINAGMIEKYKHIDEGTNLSDRKNANTIGAHSLLTLIHETQHTFQSEGVMDFALNKETDPHERARDAIMLMRLSLSQYVNDYSREKFNKEENKEIMDLLKNSYWFDSMEHDSNMAPVKFMNRLLKDKVIDDEVFVKAVEQRAIKDIHINKCVDETEIPQTLKERGDKMEQVINEYLRHFKNVMQDGTIKNNVVTVMEAYMKKDENGLSQYRKDLNKDFQMCLNFIEYSKKNTTRDVRTEEQQKSDMRKIISCRGHITDDEEEDALMME